MTFEFFIPGRLPGMNEIVELNNKLVPWLSKGKRRVYEYTLVKDRWTKHIARIIGKQKRQCGADVMFILSG